MRRLVCSMSAALVSAIAVANPWEQPMVDVTGASTDIETFSTQVGVFLLACIGLMIMAAVVWAIVGVLRNK